MKTKNIKSVLIVTDQGIVTNGLIAPLEEVLKNNSVNYAIYDKTQPNPTVNNVEEALQLYRNNNCDALIAIGGGSSMDCAKALGARVAYPQKSSRSDERDFTCAPSTSNTYCHSNNCGNRQ